MEYKIRAMTQEDWQRVAQIYYQGMISNEATFTTVVPTYEEWDTAHLQIGRLVATYEDKVVGWAALSPISSRAIYSGVTELSIYIDNDFKGVGIGTTLIKRVIEVCDASDIWTIQSSIMADNEGSLALHRKCGFREVGYREKLAKDREGNWRDTVLVERRYKD
ncbi:MAG: N-acetyltransferase family protein [Niameybacter sp.]|uniref:GNAT family N-acetyltransferase n=1 Tax=Niameybacter sp. TaxID=2033640 RepID=UPI002FC8BC3B